MGKHIFQDEYKMLGCVLYFTVIVIAVVLIVGACLTPAYPTLVAVMVSGSEIHSIEARRNPISIAALGRVLLVKDFGGGGVAEAFAGAVVEQGFDLANLLPGDALEARSFGKELTY